MRLMKLRPLLGRSLQGLLAVSALLVLTGAKGEGCGGPGGGGTDPEPPVCEPGTHVELVCIDSDAGPLCTEQCVPDSVCPPGTIEQVVCDAGSPCDPNMPMPPPQEECWTECVPTVCPDGSPGQVVCDPSIPPPPPGEPLPTVPPGCWIECPGEPPVCPPGTIPVESCDAYGNCWFTCEPDPNACPPGTTPVESCDPYGNCTYTCEPVDPQPPCPPGTVPVVSCNASGTCTFTCELLDQQP